MATRTGRPSAITKLSDTDSTGKRNWLIYGPSGEGKTVLAGTAPNALFLTCEAAGTESAKLFGSTADEWVMDDRDTLQEALRYFRDGTGCKDYEWVIHDSLSEIEDLMWYDVQGDRNSKKIQEYGEIGTMMKKWVDAWNRLPINVLYTATAMLIDVPGETDEDDEHPMLVPSLGTQKGRDSLSICAKASLVGRLQTLTRPAKDGEVEERRILNVRSSNNFIAKDRHGLALKTGRIVNPNIEKMFAKAKANAKNGIAIPSTSSESGDGTEPESGGEDTPRRRRRASGDED